MIRTRLRFALFFLVGVAIAIACGNSFTARAEYFSIGDPARVWNKKELRVCWLSDVDVMRRTTFLGVVAKPKLDRIPIEVRKMIRGLLASNYPEYLTGIRFTGFGDCPEGRLDGYDVLISNGFEFRDDSVNTGFSSVGDDHVPTISVGSFDHSMVAFNFKSSDVMNRVKNDWFFAKLRKFGEKGATRSEAFGAAYARMSRVLGREHVRITVLHEFGHLFGLVHEDARKDAPAVGEFPFCWTFSSAYRDETSTTAPMDGKPAELSRFDTPYDLFSIMSYCLHDMADWYERARFLCEWAKPMRLVSGLPEKDRPAMRRVLDQCAFIESTAFPIEPTRGDRFGIRSLYQLPQSDGAEDTDYRKSETKMKWVSIFTDFASQSWLDGDPVGDYLDALKKKKKPPTPAGAGGFDSKSN